MKGFPSDAIVAMKRDIWHETASWGYHKNTLEKGGLLRKKRLRKTKGFLQDYLKKDTILLQHA